MTTQDITLSVLVQLHRTGVVPNLVNSFVRSFGCSFADFFFFFLGCNSSLDILLKLVFAAFGIKCPLGISLAD